MAEQMEEICIIDIVYLVVKYKGWWWLIPEPLSHSFFLFFFRKTNPINFSIQRGNEGVSTKAQTIFVQEF